MALHQRQWQGLEIVRRAEDGFFDATATAAAFNKQVYEFLRLERTKTYMQALQQDEDSSLHCVVKTTHGKDAKSWFHPRLMLDFTRWLDVRFAVWMDKWIFEVLSTARHETSFRAEGTTTVAQRQEAARPKPLYLHQTCILNERDLHVQVVAEVRRLHPQALLVGGICEQAEGASGRALAVQLGYTAGQPDLLVLNRGPKCAGLALEFKHPGFDLERNPPSEAQLRYHRRLRECGWRVVVCNSAFEAVLCIDDYMRNQVQHCCECCGAWWTSEQELLAHVRRKATSAAAGSKRRPSQEADGSKQRVARAGKRPQAVSETDPSV